MESTKVPPCDCFDFLYEGLVAAALTARLCLKPAASSDIPRAKGNTLKKHSEVMKYLFQVYHTDNVIAEADAALAKST